MAYSDSDIQKTKQILWDLRKNRGLTFKALSNELREQGVNVTDTNLRNYEINDDEHDLYDRIKGMGIEKLVGLADFYGVSTDYLVGRDVPSDPSMNGTCKFTGLSEDAVKSILNLEKGDNLDYYEDSNYVPQYVKILNTLFEMGLIANIVQAFSRFLCRDRKDRDLNAIWIGSEKECEEANELTCWLLHKDITNAVEDVTEGSNRYCIFSD